MPVKQEQEKKNPFWKDLWQKGRGDKKGKSLFLVLLLLLGIMLMLSSSYFKYPATGSLPPDGPVKTKVSGKETALSRSYEEDLVNSLQETLEGILGVSNVQVFIYFSGGKESIYARNMDENSRQTTEIDREGGTREISEHSRRDEYVLLRDGAGEKALLIKENTPRVEGVLVVAGGVERSALRLKVVRAIQGVLELPVHRIAVLPSGAAM